jgi:acetyl-CoA carboxylase carboxyltransferase component
MTWDPELAELAQRTRLAAQLGGAERVERQHATGRMTVRERLDALLDEGSWREVGSVAAPRRTTSRGTCRRCSRPASWPVPAPSTAAAWS